MGQRQYLCPPGLLLAYGQNKASVTRTAILRARGEVCAGKHIRLSVLLKSDSLSTFIALDAQFCRPPTHGLQGRRGAEQLQANATMH